MSLLQARKPNHTFQKRLTQLLVLASAVISIVFASNATAYTVADAADWVIERQSPQKIKDAKYRATDGVYYRLYDKQVNAIKPNDRSVYYAMEYELTNRSGVSAKSTIEIDYDPNYESIIIHKLGIIRNGKYIDRLTPESYEELRTERQLDELLYNGTTTLAAILEDVRVGDVIKHSYTIKGSNPVYADIVEVSMATQYYVGVELAAFRLLVDAKTDMHVRKQDVAEDFKLHETENDGIRSYSWSKNNLRKLKYVEDEPEWTSIDPAFSISSVSDWSDIVSWSLPHYNKSDMQSDELIEVAQRIREQNDSTEEYIGAALQWVQNEIRYFGVELGENSHNPSHPDTTLSRRFGDCKDKAVLLISLLDELNIDAQPALVNTRDQLRREDFIYRLHAFNHVIVHVEHKGVSHWIDPTRQYQMGKLGDFYEPDFGFALIIDKHSNELSPMTNPNAIFKVRLRKQLKISDENSNWGDYSIRTERAGDSAEKQRRWIDNKGLEQVTENYLNYYRGIYNVFDLAEPIRFTEFPRNKNYTFESYEMGDVWGDNDNGEGYLEVFTEQIQQYLPTPGAPKYRNRPFYLGQPVQTRETTTLYLPDIVESGDYSKKISNDYFDFSIYIDQNVDDKILSISHSLELKTLLVSKDDLQSYVKDVQLAERFMSWNVTPSGLTWSDDSENSSDESGAEQSEDEITQAGVSQE